jgi:predicted glycogen debranching enzyme
MTPPDDLQALLTREWLVTNGLGGYAAGSVSGVMTRRYHALLVAALPAPLGRIAMLTHVWERLRFPDRSVVVLSDEDHVGGALDLHGVRYLEDFCLDTGLPVWRYRVGEALLEKRLLMPHGQNSTHLAYRLVEGPGPLRLTLRPSVNFRPHHAAVSQPLGGPYTFTAVGDRYELTADPDYPPLRLRLHADHGAFTVDPRTTTGIRYRVEERRGYDHIGEVWSPATSASTWPRAGRPPRWWRPPRTGRPWARSAPTPPGRPSSTGAHA